MLSQEYKKAVFDSLDKMTSEEMIHLLKSIDSVQVFPGFNCKIDVIPCQLYTFSSNADETIINIKGDYVA
ncbi:hypothetical protein ACE418_03355 [Megasphaera sp. WILCCON 0056]|uniref:hypothetical protein n=1 Tax=Megasphaera sp. WILCCON 0056 TaxID=3345340 RepID=UPI003A7F96F6